MVQGTPTDTPTGGYTTLQTWKTMTVSPLSMAVRAHTTHTLGGARCIAGHRASSFPPGYVYDFFRKLL